ncbi:glycosyl hydrolase family 95 catalytic domain-containing protein [Streptacidiphilus sp. PAMC 29251]
MRPSILSVRRRRRSGPRRALSVFVTSTLLTTSCVALSLSAAAPASADTGTTAWSSSGFSVDKPNVVERSDIVLGSPNTDPHSAMGLGNGSVGAAVWAAGGFTAQLNRDDTFPDRKSPGQVTIPGLAAITGAADFHARLDLYTGTLVETGGGMTASIYIRADKDELVVDVTGADPNATQTVTGALWTGRSPTAAVSGKTGTLAETWLDNGSGGTGNTFGSLLAVTAAGTNVTATKVAGKSVKLSFTPHADGSFRVLIGAPTWTGGTASSTASPLFGSDATATSAALAAPQLAWWQNYWNTADLMEITSADGSGEYAENLRTLYLYEEASLVRGVYPGTQAGLADLFSWDQDNQLWVPSDYWFWNQRMQIAANLSSGESALNTSYFNLYTNNIANLQAWTAAHMPGKSGICVPETMRFNGNGAFGDDAGNASCDSTIDPSYNSLTVTTGSEVALWIWQQYQVTHNTAFLQAGYPLMKAAAQFLLSYATLGSDGKLHTTANAHETQWDVTDPITDISAMKAVWPMTVSAAQALNVDSGFVSQLTTAETQIPDFPRTDQATHTKVLTASSDAAGKDVLAYSTQPAADQQNDENPDLEAVYPYGLIGDSGSNLALANRTWTSREHPDRGDYAFDGLQAARLGRPADVKQSLLDNIEYTQMYANGLADLDGGINPEPYIEQGGMIAATLNEGLVQDYDGLIRIAPAWPAGWDVSGSVAVQQNSTVDVQVHGGVTSTVVLEAGGTAAMKLRTPWPGQSVTVVDATSQTTAVAATTASTLTINATSGHTYLVELAGSPFTALPFAPVTGSPATVDKHLGSRQIGTDGTSQTVASSFNNVGVTDDSSTDAGNFDGGGSSFSQQALATAGLTAGATITHGGVHLTWPGTAGAGQPDNIVASGQTISLTGTGSTLGFLAATSYGNSSGDGTLTYTDGSTQDFTLSTPDWWGPPGSTAVIAHPGYLNQPGNTTDGDSTYVYYLGVPLTAGKTLQSVTLPNISPDVEQGTAALHIFAISAS